MIEFDKSLGVDKNKNDADADNKRNSDDKKSKHGDEVYFPAQLGSRAALINKYPFFAREIDSKVGRDEVEQATLDALRAVLAVQKFAVMSASVTSTTVASIRGKDDWLSYLVTLSNDNKHIKLSPHSHQAELKQQSGLIEVKKMNQRLVQFFTNFNFVSKMQYSCAQCRLT